MHPVETLTMTDDKRFAATISGLAEAFGRKASVAMVRAYRIGLVGLTIEAIEQAAANALRTSKFMPSPAELRELTGELPPAVAGGDGPDPYLLAGKPLVVTVAEQWPIETRGRDLESIAVGDRILDVELG